MFTVPLFVHFDCVPFLFIFFFIHSPEYFLCNFSLSRILAFLILCDPVNFILYSIGKVRSHDRNVQKEARYVLSGCQSRGAGGLWPPIFSEM